MKKYLTILLIFCIGCKSNKVNKWISYATFDSLIKATPANGTLDLNGDSVLYSHTIIRTENINFKNAYLKRENQVTYTLQEDATDKYVILDSTTGLLEADRFIVANGHSWRDCSAINVIIKIKGDTVFTNTSLLGWKQGVHFYKNINFFWSLSVGRYTDQTSTFRNVIFDGNRENNKGSYYWGFNTAMLCVSKGLTSYNNCKFINSPNESIAGHNSYIDSCEFINLNGSGFHSSADRMNCSENEIHSVVKNSKFENTNQISSSITGHSEGAITESNSGGYYTATYNTFKNVGESVIGSLYHSQHIHDWGDHNILFEHNTIDSAGRIIYNISYDGEKLKNVKIINNVIKNVPYYDYGASLIYNDIELQQMDTNK